MRRQMRANKANGAVHDLHADGRASLVSHHPQKTRRSGRRYTSERSIARTHHVGHALAERLANEHAQKNADKDLVLDQHVARFLPFTRAHAIAHRSWRGGLRRSIPSPARRRLASGSVPPEPRSLPSDPPFPRDPRRICRPAIEKPCKTPTVGFPDTEPVSQILMFSSIFFPFTFQVPNQNFRSRRVVYSGSLHMNAPTF